MIKFFNAGKNFKNLYGYFETEFSAIVDYIHNIHLPVILSIMFPVIASFELHSVDRVK